MRSCLAIIQFLAVLLIFVGLVVLPGWMHSGDSAVIDPIRDEPLQNQIRTWHDHQVRVAAGWLAIFGGVQFAVSSAAVMIVRYRKYRREGFVPGAT